MKKVQFETIEHIFDATRRGAKYSLDGKSFFNGGEMAEIAVKAGLGYEHKKDANTPFDKGSDIEEIHASVKSSKATLTSVKLGDSYNEIKTSYFNRVASKVWVWVVMYEDSNTTEAYFMNKDEFSEFMDEWSGYDKSRKVIRFKATTGKMVQWLEARV